MEMFPTARALTLWEGEEEILTSTGEFAPLVLTVHSSGTALVNLYDQREQMTGTVHVWVSEG